MPKRSASPSVARPRSKPRRSRPCEARRGFFVALGGKAAEVGVAIVVDDLTSVGFEEEVVEVVARRSVERVDGDAQPALADDVDVDLRLQLVEIAVLRIDLFDQLGLLVDIDALAVAATAPISSSIRFRDLGQRRAPLEVENFRPLYSGGLCEAVKLIAPIALRRTGFERGRRAWERRAYRGRRECR